MRSVHEDLEHREDRDQESADHGDPTDVALDVGVLLGGADRQWHRRVADATDGLRRRAPSTIARPTRILSRLLLGEDGCFELGRSRLFLAGDAARLADVARVRPRSRALERSSLAGTGREAGALRHLRWELRAVRGSGRRIASDAWRGRDGRSADRLAGRSG